MVRTYQPIEYSPRARRASSLWDHEIHDDATSARLARTNASPSVPGEASAVGRVA